MKLCKMQDCTNKHAARGLCQTHYGRARKEGTLDEVAPLTLKHSLTDKDTEASTATCAICGPNTPMEYRKRQKYWRCGVNASNQRESLVDGTKPRYFYGTNKEFGHSRNEAADIRAKFEEEQSGLCAICDEPSEQTLHLDHCHETGEFRGLLCRNHNIGLGNFKDNIEHLQKAIAYLEKTQSPPTVRQRDCGLSS